MSDDQDRGKSGSPQRKRRRRRRRGAAEGGGDHSAASGGARGEGQARSRTRRRKRPAEGSDAPRSEPREGGRRRRRRRRGGDRPGRSDAGPSPTPTPARNERRRPKRDRSQPSEPDSAALDVEGPESWSDAAIPIPADEHPTEVVPPQEDRHIELEADLPLEAADDLDPVTAYLDDDEVAGELTASTVRNIVGVKFTRAGKIYPHDAGDLTLRRGEEVVVDSDRGPRLGTVAIDSVRKAHGQVKRVLRRPEPADRAAAERNADRLDRVLDTARALARKRKMPIKVFRAETPLSGGKIRIYFSADERVDSRGLARDLGRELSGRVEMRQTGVRDEAKMVGGIGSCGRELCCTTWLPEFVPVSIKMAKDQGLVLNPTKVSGQCGRLKCCLVYEQELYAKLRKGLPKLGKRVITESGEGRVVEVDVLAQRVRVSLGPGEFVVFPAGEVKPMFPSQKPNKPGKKQRRGDAAADEEPSNSATSNDN